MDNKERKAHKLANYASPQARAVLKIASAIQWVCYLLAAIPMAVVVMGIVLGGKIDVMLVYALV